MRNLKRPLRARVSREEYQLLQRLRESKPAQHPPQPPMRTGDRIADQVAALIGSWRFIIVQTAVLAMWVALNLSAYINHWDPYPFILLNLMLSFQAAYSAPIIMMSQNRQATIDRQEARHDYQVNMKSELEIELLHDKMNLLREEEMASIVSLLRDQQQRLRRIEEALIQIQSAPSHKDEDFN